MGVRLPLLPLSRFPGRHLAPGRRSRPPRGACRRCRPDALRARAIALSPPASNRHRRARKTRRHRSARTVRGTLRRLHPRVAQPGRAPLLQRGGWGFDSLAADSLRRRSIRQDARLLPGECWFEPSRRSSRLDRLAGSGRRSLKPVTRVRIPLEALRRRRASAGTRRSDTPVLLGSTPGSSIATGRGGAWPPRLSRGAEKCTTFGRRKVHQRGRC